MNKKEEYKPLVESAERKKQLGDLRGAMTDYDKAIGLNPDDPRIWSKRGLIRLRLGNFQGATEDHEKSIQLEPHRAVRWLSF